MEVAEVCNHFLLTLNILLIVQLLTLLLKLGFSLIWEEVKEKCTPTDVQITTKKHKQYE
jgi:hypothetical protein